MKKYYIKILFALLFVAGLISCSASRKMTKSPQPLKIKKYNSEAMDHIIDGALADIMGSPKDAIVDYQQAAEIDTSSAGVYLALAENYYFIEELKTSIRLAQKALRIDPENVDALELTAACYEKLRNYRSAMLVYKRIAKLQPNDLQSLYRLVSLQIVTRKYDDAITTYHSMVNNGLDTPDFRLKVGNLFLQSRAFPQAEKVYLDIQKQYPDFQDVYLALAATEKARGDTTKAIKWYRTALDQNIHFDDAKAELRVLFEKTKKWDEAIKVFSSLIARDSTNLSDKINLGRFYFQKGDTAKALTTVENIVKQHPKSERAYLALAAFQKLKGDTTAAIQTYKAGLKARPSFLDVRQRLRDLYVNKKLWDDAIALYEPLKDTDSTFVGARIEIANLKLQKGDTLQAIKECRELNKTHGDDWRVPVTLGRMYFVAGQYQKASPHLKKAIQLRNDLPQLWVLLGINYLQLDSTDAALTHFKKAAEKFPEEPEINYYLGSILSRKKKFTAAIHYLEKSDDKDPGNVQTMLALAGAYDETRQYNRSEKIYQELVKTHPDSPIILNNYAYHLSVQGVRLNDALAMVKKALQADPDNAPYLDTLGWIYYQIGDLPQAKAHIEKSLSINKDSPEVLEHLGDVYHKIGDQDAAEKYWRRALALDKNRQRLLQKLGQTMP